MTSQSVSLASISLPYRGRSGDPRPPALNALALPPGPMPPRVGLRPLKAWRYVGLYGPELMLCAGLVRVGPLRQSFWAIWDRSRGELRERTRTGRGRLALPSGQLRIHERDVQVELELDEVAGAPETVSRSGPAGYAWTRKQGGIEARGTVRINGLERPVSARAVIDDTAAYYERHTAWLWSAGVGTSADGRPLAWNLVSGVNDDPAGSERTVWVDGEPQEAPPVEFAPDLSHVGDLGFTAEATRSRTDNLLLVRSSYRQPFGTFAGRLPTGIELADGYGVMEAHEAWW